MFIFLKINKNLFNYYRINVIQLKIAAAQSISHEPSSLPNYIHHVQAINAKKHLPDDDGSLSISLQYGKVHVRQKPGTQIVFIKLEPAAWTCEGGIGASKRVENVGKEVIGSKSGRWKLLQQKERGSNLDRGR